MATVLKEKLKTVIKCTHEHVKQLHVHVQCTLIFNNKNFVQR